MKMFSRVISAVFLINIMFQFSAFNQSIMNNSARSYGLEDMQYVAQTGNSDNYTSMIRRPRLFVNESWVYNYTRYYWNGTRDDYLWKKRIIDIEEIGEQSFYIIADEIFRNGEATTNITEWRTIQWIDMKSRRIYEDKTVEVLFDPGYKNYDFPIYVGKEWMNSVSLSGVTTYRNGSVESGSYLLEERCVVTREDTISLSAGIFWTLVVEVRTMTQGLEGYVDYVWFSPEAKNFVKYSSYFNGSLIEDLELRSLGVTTLPSTSDCKPLIDATHATHPFGIEDYQGIFTESSVLTFNHTHTLMNETFSDVNESIETVFDVNGTIPVLGFEIKYNGPWGRMAAEVKFPNDTIVEVENDTIFIDKTWFFHFHNPAKGMWTLEVTVKTEEVDPPISIHVIIGECSEPLSKEVLEKYDFLILLSPEQSYSSGEISIIRQFLSGGGSVFVGGESGNSIWGANLNQLIEPFGIVLGPYLNDSTDNTGVDFQPLLHNFTEHPIAIRAKSLGVDELTIRAGGALVLTNPDAQIVLRGDNDTTAQPIYSEGSFPPFAATLVHGWGLLFVQGDTYPGDGNGKWYQAIAEWLVGEISPSLAWWVPSRDSYSQINYASVWSGGNCYGLSSTEILYFMHYVLGDITYPYYPAQSPPATWTSNLKLPTNHNVLNNVSLAVMFHQVYDPNNWFDPPSSEKAEYDKLLETLESGTPVLLLMHGIDSTEGDVYHAIVAYNIEHLPNGTAIIKVSDPNVPQQAENAKYDPFTETFSYTAAGFRFDMFEVVTPEMIQVSWASGPWWYFGTYWWWHNWLNFSVTGYNIVIADKTVTVYSGDLRDYFIAAGNSQTFICGIPSSAGIEEGNVQVYAIPEDIPFTVSDPAPDQSTILIGHVNNESGELSGYGYLLSATPTQGSLNYNVTPSNSGLLVSSGAWVLNINTTIFYATLQNHFIFQASNIQLGSMQTANFTVNNWQMLNDTSSSPVTLTVSPIVPEYSPILILPLSMVATLVAVIVYKRKLVGSERRIV